MLFNTPEFIVFFIVVLATLAIIKYRKFQHLFLLFASYFFFYFSSNYLITLLIFTTIWDFYFGKAIWKANTTKQKKILLVLSLAGNLGLLGFFKYADFAITQFNILGAHFDLNTIPLMNLALPIGISFYTFHSITYTVGIYRGIIEPVRLREYALFVTFFPQLVAGPILRAHQFLPQLREKIEGIKTNGVLRQIVLENSNLKFGITLMALGFLKKMFFADNIAPLANDIFVNPIGLDSFSIMIGAIAFGIQIYCDFSGYSDIAIGIAIILGFKFPLNFNKPYFATSPSDFWRRWHISLSTWLRDYLYVPLGGNRISKYRTYFNLMTVMFLGGLWHGASWNFVVWGMLHGLYLVVHKIILDKVPFLRNHMFFKTRMGTIFSILFTQYLVFLTWIAFRVTNYEDLVYSMTKYVFLDFAIQKTTEIIMEHKFKVLLIVLFVGLHFISYRKQDLPNRLSNLKSPYWFIFLLAIMLTILFFYDGNPEDFIYFQF
jgi:alginate O-acetyltransferase complex protein AlgI